MEEKKLSIGLIASRATFFLKGKYDRRVFQALVLPVASRELGPEGNAKYTERQKVSASAKDKRSA